LFNILSEVRKLSMAPSSGSEAQVSKIQKIVDRMFNDNSGANKGPSSTISDRFFTQPAITDAKLRLKHFEQMRAEARFNDAQVQFTNVKMGSYSGWKPRGSQKSKHNLPKPSLNKQSTCSLSTAEPYS
jgi:hypothetical protein